MAAPPPPPTRPRRSRPSGRLRSASPTSSSTPSRSRPSCLPIYQACGTEYGIPWEVLASINKIETGFGTNLNVSSAGAVGWMQFLPSSWEAFGVDANGDGRKDPYNPVDAICAAAHYLKLSGGTSDLYNAILAYNHADWYVEEVLLYARAYGKLPSDLVGSLTGLTEGAHFPVAADASYADDISAREALKRAKPGARDSLRQRRRRDLLVAHPARDQHLLRRGRPGRRRQRRRDREDRRLARARPLRGACRTPTATASPTPSWARSCATTAAVVMPSGKEKRGSGRQPEPATPPLRAAGAAAGSSQGPDAAARRNNEDSRETEPSRVGSKVIAGTVLARIGGGQGGIDPHINFSIRPAGKRRPANRPEADPRRLEAARGDRDLPRQGQEPVRRGSQRRRCPAALQGGAGAAGPGRQQPLDLRMRSRRHRHRPDRPARPGNARVRWSPKASS